jgi:hypothetical protein
MDHAFARFPGTVVALVIADAGSGVKAVKREGHHSITNFCYELVK